MKDSRYSTHRQVPAGKCSNKAETLSLRLPVSHSPCRMVGCLNFPAHMVTIDLRVVLRGQCEEPKAEEELKGRGRERNFGVSARMSSFLQSYDM